jgi:hypothetical protein
MRVANLEHLAYEFERLHNFVMVDGGKNDPCLASRVTTTETTIARISANLGKIVWLLVGIFVTIVADAVVHASGAHF